MKNLFKTNKNGMLNGGVEQHVTQLKKELLDTKEHLQLLQEKLEMATKEVQTVKQLGTTKATLESVIENFDGYVWSMDNNYRYMAFNSRLQRVIKDLYGIDLKPGDRVQAVLETVDPGKVKDWEELYETAFKGQPKRMTHEFTVADKHVFFDLSLNPIWENDSVIGVTCFAMDITEKELRKKQLNEVQVRFRSLIENSHNGIALISDDEKFTYLTPSVKRLTDYDPEEILGTNAFNLVHPEDVEGVKDVLSDLRGRPAETIQTTYRVRIKSGAWIHLQANVTNMLHEPCINAFVFNYEDVTEKLKAEEKISRSEVLYRNLFNKSPLPKWLCDPKTLQYLEVNDKALSLYGYSREEFLKMSAFDLRDESNREELKEFIRTSPSNEYRSGLVKHRKKNGEIIFVEIFAHRIKLQNQEAFLVVANDISETLLLQNQLHEEKINKQKEVMKATIDGQEKQRAQIASELHDNVNQMLATAKILLGYSLEQNEEGRKFIKKSMNIINDSIEEIRRLSRSFMPPSLGETGLTVAIEELLANLETVQQAKLIRQLCITNESALGDGLKLSIYRIVQEQLNNIIKYASASEITVKIEQSENAVFMMIADNGRGFDTSVKRKGIGLTNIINRAETYNGTVTIQSEPGAGCILSVKFAA